MKKNIFAESEEIRRQNNKLPTIRKSKTLFNYNDDKKQNNIY